MTGDLVDYLRDKLAHADGGCTCPTPEWMSTLPLDVEVLTDCVEHGRRRLTAGGFGYLRIGARYRTRYLPAPQKRKRWWRR